VERAGRDQDQAAREAHARRRLLRAGAAAMPRPPWLHKRQPPSAVDLIQFALWRAGTGDLTDEDLSAALTLLPAARAEVDQVEAALLFAARADGLSWSRIARAIGLGSAQAAKQRFDRVAGRVEDRGGP
jgi:hypothetical protein